MTPKQENTPEEEKNVARKSNNAAKTESSKAEGTKPEVTEAVSTDSTEIDNIDTDNAVEEDTDEIVANGSTSEVGSIIEVEVTNIADFGVFVRCDDGEEGLIHISEVANEFVTNLSKYVKLNERIKVKVLGRNKKGKLEFSIKKIEDKKPKKALFIRTSSEDKGFEDILTKYLKRSEEKQIDIRRSLKRKHKIIKKKH